MVSLCKAHSKLGSMIFAFDLTQQAEVHICQKERGNEELAVPKRVLCDTHRFESRVSHNFD